MYIDLWGKARYSSAIVLMYQVWPQNVSTSLNRLCFVQLGFVEFYYDAKRYVDKPRMRITPRMNRKKENYAISY